MSKDNRGFGRLQRRVDDVLSNPIGKRWTVSEIHKRIGGRRHQRCIYRSLIRMEARDAVRREPRPWPQGHLWYNDHETARATRMHDKRRIRRFYAGCRVKDPVIVESTIVRLRAF